MEHGGKLGGEVGDGGNLFKRRGGGGVSFGVVDELAVEPPPGGRPGFCGLHPAGGLVLAAGGGQIFPPIWPPAESPSGGPVHRYIPSLRTSLSLSLYVIINK